MQGTHSEAQNGEKSFLRPLWAPNPNFWYLIFGHQDTSSCAGLERTVTRAVRSFLKSSGSFSSQGISRFTFSLAATYKAALKSNGSQTQREHIEMQTTPVTLMLLLVVGAHCRPQGWPFGGSFGGFGQNCQGSQCNQNNAGGGGGVGRGLKTKS